MRRTHQLSASIAVALLLAATIGAAEQEVGAIQADRATLEGPSILRGAPLAFQDFDTYGRPSTARFHLEAKQLHSEVAVYSGYVATAAPAVSPQESGDVERDDFVDVVADSGMPRLSHYFGVFANDASTRFELESDGGEMRPSDLETIESPEFFPSKRSPMEKGLDAALRWTQPPAEGRLTIRGNFTVVLWEWDVTLTEAGREYVVTTGQQDSAIAPDPTGISPSVAANRTQRQAFLSVTDGLLDLPWLSPETFLYLGRGDVVLDGRVAFEAPTGHLADGTQLADSFELEGVLLLAFEPPQGGRIPFQIRGDVRAASSDGEAVPWTLPGGSSGEAFPWFMTLLMVGVALPGLAVGGTYGRRRQQGYRMERLESFMASGQFETVSKKADALLSSKDFAKDAAVLKVESLVRLGRYDEAGGFLATLKPWTGSAAPMIDFLHGYVLVLRGKTEDAILRLEVCLAVAPEFRQEVATTPSFAPVRSDPRIAKFLNALSVDSTSLGAYT